MPNTQASTLRSIVENIPGGPPESAPVEPPAPQVIPRAESAAKPVDNVVTKVAPGHAGHLKILVENAPIAMAMFDADMRYLVANRRWMDDFKLQNVEIIGRCQYEIFPSLHPGWRHVYERALQGQVVRSDRDSVTRDGQRIVYRWEVRPWRHVDTSIGGVMVTCERLSAGGAPPAPVEEKKAFGPTRQDALWESALPMVAMDAEGKILRASTGAAGYFKDVESGSARFWHAYGETADNGPVHERTRQALESAFAKPLVQTLFSLPEDALLGARHAPAHWQFSVVKGGDWGQAGGVVMAIGLLTLPPTQIAPPALAMAAPPLHVPAFAPAPETAIVSHPMITTPVAAAADAELQRLAEELARMRLAHKEVCGNELVARQREARLRSVLDVLPYGMLVLDERGRPIYHNKAVATLVGHGLEEGQSVEEWLAKCCRDEQHTDEVIRLWREGVWRKQLVKTLALAGAGGLLRDIEFTPAVLAAGGFIITLRDVSEARRSEEMLRGAEAKFRAVVHESPLPVIMTDRSGAVFDVNAEAEMLLGYTRAELRRMPIERWLTPEAAQARGAALRDMSRCGARSSTVTLDLIDREDQPLPAVIRLASVADAAGSPQYTVHFIQIREVKPEPAPVAASPDQAASAAPSGNAPTAGVSRSTVIPVTLLSTDVNGRVETWTQEASELFGHSESEALGRGLHQWFRPSDATGFYSHLATLVDVEGETATEWMFLHKDDGRKMGRFTVKPLTAGGLAVEVLMDKTITVSAPEVSTEAAAAPPAPDAEAAQTTSEPRLPAPPDLKREMLLLGETHHRVKNHLQIITSMLNLQISTLHNEEARDALRSSQNRVRSIAALHQHLYELASGDNADFNRFASGLIKHLFECYDVEEGRIDVNLNLAHVAVPEEWLMPLALSLNEMVSNALKHAFPGGRKGSITVDLGWGEDRSELVVTDNGKGLPEGFDDTTVSGLGLKIMRVFAGQLGGEVIVSSEPEKGAVFTLRFPQTIPAADSQDEA